MKQNVSKKQVFDYIKTDKNIMKNIIKLGKAIRNDYEGIIGYAKIFERKNNETAIAEVVEIISLDYSIGKMIEILQKKDVKITMDNAIPSSIKDLKNNKIYCEQELCDALWKAIINNI